MKNNLIEQNWVRLLVRRAHSLLALCAVLLLSISGLVEVRAQATYVSLPYFDGLEDGVMNSGWKLNPGVNGATAENKWYVSGVESFMGDSALIISGDGGKTLSYTNKAVYSVAYKEIALPKGMYDLSFTWKCEGDADKDGFYVCWVSGSTNTNSSVTAPTWLTNGMVKGIPFLNASKEWVTTTGQITQQSATKAGKLVFVWKNDASVVNPPSVVIDNIQIAKSDGCGKPENVTVSALSSNITVKWDGGATGYEMMYKKYGDEEVHVVKGINQTSHTLKDMEEGVYDVFVRSCCPDDTSIWVVKNNVLAYDPTAHCIDFINWDNQGTTFETGKHVSGGKFDADGKFVPNVTTGSVQYNVVDYGYKSISSRHTKHYIPGEMDPNTGNELPTVPEGEVVSVRLGNWNYGGEWESVTYTHQLDSGSNMILTLKYAVVIEDPGHQPRSDQPVFMLELLDEYNNPLDATGCGDANFVADTKSLLESSNADGTWHIIRGGGTPILWKEWTSVGINVGQYAKHGPLKFKVRLTTYDCAITGHFGYAYFTLSCSEAKIEGISCGDNAGKNILAPSGFNYRWYRARDGKTVCTTQNLQGLEKNDTALYKCKVMFAQDSTCYFELDAELLPRFPKAQFSPRWVPRNCNENYMKFQNTSHVTTARGATGEKCETHKWYIKKGDNFELIQEGDSLEYRFPNEGGQYEMMLWASISGGECDDDTIIVVNVPRLGAVVDTITDTICEGKSFKIEGRKYTQEGVYRVFRGVNYGGCDSTVYLDLTVIPKERDTIAAYICGGSCYNLNGQEFCKSGRYRTVYKADPESKCECDTVVTLYLSVANVNVPKKVDLCSGDDLYIEYEVADGEFVSYEILFTDSAKAFGFKDIAERELNETKGRLVFTTADLTDSKDAVNPVRPGRYEMRVIFYYKTDDGTLESCVHKVELNVMYAAATIAQKFDNLLVLLDSDNNGGYTFSNYQWYENGQPIEGETTTYLYLDEIGPKPGATYAVGLVRDGETEEIMTCWFRMNNGTPVDDVTSEEIGLASNVVAVGERVLVLMEIGIECVVRCWTSTGILLGTENLTEGGELTITPQQQGVYVLDIEQGGKRTLQKIVIK